MCVYIVYNIYKYLYLLLLLITPDRPGLSQFSGRVRARPWSDGASRQRTRCSICFLRGLSLGFRVWVEEFMVVGYTV